MDEQVENSRDRRRMRNVSFNMSAFSLLTSQNSLELMGTADTPVLRPEESGPATSIWGQTCKASNHKRVSLIQNFRGR